MWGWLIAQTSKYTAISMLFADANGMSFDICKSANCVLLHLYREMNEEGSLEPIYKSAICNLGISTCALRIAICS